MPGETNAVDAGALREARAFLAQSDVVDLHIDTYIWSRLFGYDLNRHHADGKLDGRFGGHVDLPRLTAAGFTGATWVITTNPLPTAARRARAFVRNLQELTRQLEATGAQLVRSASDYAAARRAGRSAAFLGIQGGNALDVSLEALDVLRDGAVLRITLVHLTNSRIGVTSFPLRFSRDNGLGAFGRDYVRRLNELGVLVDLAHASKKTFWDAVEVHDRSKPFLVTHTGVDGVKPHWRNLDDKQIQAVANSGGVVGIIFHGAYLSRDGGRGGIDDVLDHAEHVIRVAGEDCVALGSDWDGAITPPKALVGPEGIVALTARCLSRGWSTERLRKFLGRNFLRSVALLRP